MNWDIKEQSRVQIAAFPFAILRLVKFIIYVIGEIEINRPLKK